MKTKLTAFAAMLFAAISAHAQEKDLIFYGVQMEELEYRQGDESENLLTFIQDEHPQTISLIISHLSHHKASEILIR